MRSVFIVLVLLTVAGPAPATETAWTSTDYVGRHFEVRDQVAAYTQYVTTQTAARSAELVAAIKNGQGAHNILTDIFEAANKLYPGVGLK